MKRILVLFVIIVACSNIKYEKNKKPIKHSINYKETESSTLNLECPKYIDDSFFAESPFVFNFMNSDSSTIKSYFKIEPNIFSEKYIDFDNNEQTLIVYKVNESYIKFFHKRKYYIDDLEVHENIIEMHHNFLIGMYKDSFLHHYKMENVSCDTFIIGGIDREVEYAFLFKSDTLNKVYLYSKL